MHCKTQRCGKKSNLRGVATCFYPMGLVLWIGVALCSHNPHTAIPAARKRCVIGIHLLARRGGCAAIVIHDRWAGRKKQADECITGANNLSLENRGSARCSRVRPPVLYHGWCYRRQGEAAAVGVWGEREGGREGGRDGTGGAYLCARPPPSVYPQTFPRILSQTRWAASILRARTLPYLSGSQAFTTHRWRRDHSHGSLDKPPSKSKMNPLHRDGRGEMGW